MGAEELLALLIGWVGRSAAQSLLHAAVNRVLRGEPLSSAGCAHSHGDPDVWGCDPEEEDPCRN